jgi:hypothetical protein
VNAFVSGKAGRPASAKLGTSSKALAHPAQSAAQRTSTETASREKTGNREVRPEEIIPFDEDQFKDF